MTRLFLDANIPMYASGAPHPLKQPCLQIIRLAARRDRSFVTDAEVLQEILHRYMSLHRWSDATDSVRDFAEVMIGRVEAVTADDVVEAASLVQTYRQLSARDLLHLAVMRRVRIAHVVSADRGFDTVQYLTRLDPADLASWEHLITGEA